MTADAERSRTYRLLRVAHLLGFATFLGSVLSHVVVGLSAGEPGTIRFLAARDDIVSTTQALTAPGLALTVVSGVGLTLSGRLSPLRQRWLSVHAGLAIVVTVVAIAVLLPAGQTIAAEAATLVRTSDPAAVARIASRLRVESVIGAINIALTLAIVALGVLKPVVQTVRGRSAPETSRHAAAVPGVRS